MPHSASDQLDAIHAMLASGQRSLRIERHSLILWGLAAGALFLLSPYILTPKQLPDNGMRAAAWLGLLTVVLAGVGVLDWWLTRRAKRARDEAWSFIHRQVLKVWWLLMAVGALLTFAMFFFGGGYMVCAAWLVLLGLGLYVHGLFSEELLEWVGGVAILSGMGCLAAGLPFDAMTWIAASVFGFGLPLLSLMLDRGRHRPLQRRFGQTLLWLAVVLAPPALAVRLRPSPVPAATPVYSLEQFRAHPALHGLAVVALPAGTVVPVAVTTGGGILTADPDTHFSLTLAAPIQLLLKDGQLTGEARVGDGPWTAAHGSLHITIPWIRGELTPDQGPQIRSRMTVSFPNVLIR